MNSNKIPWLKAKILKKLRRHGYWGGRHTSYNNLSKGFKRHLSGDAKDAAEELIKENLILEKPTAYGREVSLNPEKKDKIERMIDEVFGDEE